MSKKNKNSSLNNFLLILILGLASFLRFFRITDLLGFWYDQGRDALVIWDMLYKGKFTLIGPMMGFTGIFRGAWYYWLIAPFYWIGHGNPIFPSVFLILTSIAAIFFLYQLGKEMGDVKSGLLAAFIASVSVYIINASRWLSDPTPTLLLSVLLIWSLFKFLKGSKWALVVSAFLSGMALQFSAATEIFYIPAIFLIVFLFRKKVRVDLVTLILAGFAFLFPFVPQLIFEMRHPGVQSGALINFLFHENTFTYAFWEIFKSRIPFDFNMIASKFWINGGMFFGPFFAVFLALLILNWKKFWSSDRFKIVFIMSLAPLLGTLFFVSNLGGVYEYYFTGYYLIWILLFSYVYMNSFRNILVKVILGLFLFFLLFFNIKGFAESYLTSLSDPKIIAFQNQISAVSWIYENTGGKPFNSDVYVPPVVPYAYEYLFLWLGETKYNLQPLTKNVDLLYTLYEVDSDHPERLQAWLARQAGIGEVVDEARFGGITVQKRLRIQEK